jgi:hypothetical protein
MQSRIGTIALVLVATGCANSSRTPIGTDEILKSENALLAIKIVDGMYYGGHILAANSYSFELHRIDLRTHSVVSTMKIEATGKPEVQIFSIGPGCYFVGEVSKWIGGTTSLYFSSSAKQSMFCANAGSITYPGDWKLTMYKSDFHASGTAAEGSYSFIWNYALTPMVNSSTLNELRDRYPLLVASHRVEISDPVHEN